MKKLFPRVFVIALLTLSLGGLFQTTQARDTSQKASSDYRFEDVLEYDPQRTYLPEPKWGRLVAPEQAGWSREKLDAARAYAETIKSDALLVIFNGLVILDYGRDSTAFSIHSVRKSLMSVMYGIYHDRGLLDTSSTLQELGIDDIGGLTEDEKQATIGELLMSMSGVYHAAAYETRGMRERRPARGAHRAGTVWFYNNWDFNALATIFNKETKTDFFEAFKTQLADPLGMEQFTLQDVHYRYEKDKSVHPAYLFKMSAVDLARVGLLYLRKGKWGDKQIVSKDWVELSTSAVHAWNKEKPTVGYGYMWKATDDGYYAAGVGGQRLYVVPKDDLVIVHLVDTTGRKKVKNSKVKRLYKMILDAYKPR